MCPSLIRLKDTPIFQDIIKHFFFQNGSIHFEKIRLVPTLPLHSCSDIINADDVFGNIALSERG